MKRIKYLPILIPIWFVCSCNLTISKKHNQEDTVSQPIKIKQLGGEEPYYSDKYYEIYTLEGCEYIVVSPGNSHFTWGTHKGNCKNPIHNKETK